MAARRGPIAAPWSDRPSLALQGVGAAKPRSLDLIAAIGEAATKPEGWSQVAALTSLQFDGACVRLGLIGEGAEVAFEVRSHDIGDPRINDFRFQTPQGNPAIAVVAATPPLTVVLREQFIDDRSTLRNPFWNAFMRPFGMWHTAVVNVFRDETRLAPMGVTRTRAQGQFTPIEMRRLRALAPHLNRAMRVHVALADMRARSGALASLADHALVGLVLLDAQGRVSHVNRRARAILDENDGLTLREGCLRASRSEESARLAALILEAAGGPAASQFLRPSGTMRVSRLSLRRPLTLIVHPTCSDGGLVGRGEAVTVAFADPERTPEAAPDLIARLYGLTRREAEIAALLARGLSPAQAAEALAMTMNTLRTHVKHLFDKVGVDRLDALVRVLLSGPGMGPR